MGLEKGVDKIISQVLMALIEEFDSLDDFTVIIKGQLYIESFINVLLESFSINSEDLELDKMMYSKKVKLCSAIGLIHIDSKSTFLKLADIRNKFAHKLSYKVSENEYLDFKNTLKGCKSLQYSYSKSIKFGNKLSELIFSLWMYLFEQSSRLAHSRKDIFQFWKKQIDDKVERNSEIVMSNFLEIIQ